MKDSETAEVIETLRRHGMTETDIERVLIFEESRGKKIILPTFPPDALDFGDWDL